MILNHPQLSPACTIANYKRLVSGDLKHIGEAMEAGSMILVDGKYYKALLFGSSVEIYSTLIVTLEIITPLINKDTLLRDALRLVSGDLKHIGVALATGSPIAIDNCVVDARELLWTNEASHYEL